MQHQISKKIENTVEITILDSESNSSDKEAYLDLLLNRTGGDSWGQWGTRYMYDDKVVYRIPKSIWDNKEFQKKYMLILLSL